ncbi:hypothetical protein GCM10009837_08060 [Streptomyces durmitorensis]|uniref:Uncharacterized protein n=1 Tax=Streptomyces durmitorensis TaxID=319947 RepID=A0ABY4PMM7_9ACTN|nr:hypothetical protein [Streptomyces durmitorensis]UQT54306.1 hypothetical protein M4V62_03985 [Streptomyces durmitorensis]
MAIELPDDLIALQQTADEEGRKLEHLDDGEREKQREAWFEAAAKAQAAVTAWARENELNRFDVEKALRQATRHPQGEGGA